MFLHVDLLFFRVYDYHKKIINIYMYTYRF